MDRRWPPEGFEVSREAVVEGQDHVGGPWPHQLDAVYSPCHQTRNTHFQPSWVRIAARVCGSGRSLPMVDPRPDLQSRGHLLQGDVRCFPLPGYPLILPVDTGADSTALRPADYPIREPQDLGRSLVFNRGAGGLVQEPVRAAHFLSRVSG